MTKTTAGRVAAVAHDRRGLDAGQPRHLDVEEDDVVAEPGRELERLRRARGFAHDGHLGVRAEQMAELRARGGLVVDEQRPDHAAGYLEPHDGAERERPQPDALAVVRGEQAVDVRKAEAGPFADARLEHALDRVARDAAPVVAHGHAQPPAPHACAYEEVQRPVGLAVLDRVLDERLDEERRQPDGERVGSGVDGHGELRPEARLFEVEVAAHVPQLLLERDELAGAREAAAEVVREREHEVARALGLRADEGGDRVERVEDEVRLHLRLQRGRRGGRQLGQLELRRELRAESLEQLDRALVERRAVGREGDDGAGRAVAQEEGHDGRRAERARGVRALGAQPERRQQRPARGERLVHRPDRAVTRGVVVGTGADERQHLVGVGDGDGAVAELLEELVGDRAGGLLGEAAAQLGERRFEQLEHRRLAPRPAHAGHDRDCARHRRSPRAAPRALRHARAS